MSRPFKTKVATLVAAMGIETLARHRVEAVYLGAWGSPQEAGRRRDQVRLEERLVSNIAAEIRRQIPSKSEADELVQRLAQLAEGIR